MRRGERPDESVGEDDAAHDIALEGALEHLAQRPLEEVAPVLLAHECMELLAGAQRFGERREDPLGERGGASVERTPRISVTRRSGEPPHGGVECRSIVDRHHQTA